MSVIFYQERLSKLVHVPNPTSLMKRVIDTLQSPTEKVYIYDIKPSYASLFLSDDTSSIYFYPNLECSRLKPPDTHYTPHWNMWINTTHAPPLDLTWIHTILNMNTKALRMTDDLLHSNRLNQMPTTERQSSINSPHQTLSDLNSSKQLTYIKKLNSILNTNKPPLTRIQTIQNLRPKWKR